LNAPNAEWQCWRRLNCHHYEKLAKLHQPTS
jgi:hypothetical protein